MRLSRLSRPTQTACMLTIIGFDADDTLWHDARQFLETEERLHALIRDHVDLELFARALNDTNERNLPRYGYGIKSYLLSAIEVLAGQAVAVPATLLANLIELGKTALDRETDLLDGVSDVLARLRGRVTLVLVTKGDLVHQEQKLGRSGLADQFDRIEIVSDKTAATYRRIFGIPPGTGANTGPHAAMIGNSVRSDILPAIAAGAWGLHVPHDLTWSHENTDLPPDRRLYRSFENIGEAGDWVLAQLLQR